MKKIYLHSIVIFLALVLFSCARESKMQSEDVASSINSTLKKEIVEEAFLELEKKPLTNLSIEQKEAFQLRAIQKFQDFVDYIKIISNPKIDTDLKEHSSLLALDLFKSDSIHLTNFLTKDSVESISLKQYLNRITTSKKPILIKVVNIELSSPLSIDTLANYTGTIKVGLKNKGKYFTKYIEVHLIEVKKDFGDKSELISEVRLGNIY